MFVWFGILTLFMVGQINYGSTTMLGRKIWRANQLGQPGWSCMGNMDSFFLDEANLMSILSLLARDAAGAPGNQKPTPIPI